ncbi:MAG TPA: glycosyltransferase family 4 protein, partial [Pedobacter sp.]|nr:glycosyltransferase family 4 protein [Pedobacter sp.]
ISYFLRKISSVFNGVSSWLDYNMPILFDKLAAKKLKNSDILITWAWSGLESIKQIKKLGGIAIVEECGSCNKFQNKILLEEYTNLDLKFETPTPDHIVERQLREAQIADYILCPSQHVMNSFIENGISEHKFRLIPYGVNQGIFKPKWIENEEFTIIFVGTIGVRKGLIYLFKALELLEIPFKCILIGSVETQFQEYYRQYAHLFTHYVHVPHHELVDYYNKASAFVFPSLDEGMALVQLEAMACGLPIICTPNSGGDSVVTEGIEGYIVPIRNPSAIAQKITHLYNNPALRNSMARKASESATLYNWETYGIKLANFINSI